MGFLSSILGSPPTSDPLHPWWYNILTGRKVTSGVSVDENSAMNYSACWAATRLLTGTISTLPRELYFQDGRNKEKAKGHPTRRAFKREPNPRQGDVVYFEQQFNYLINWGNAFAEKVRDEFGRVIQTWPIHPCRIPKENYKDGIYYVKNDDLTLTPIPEEDMLHVPGLFPDDDRFGKGVVAHGAESIGMGLATEQHGASFFGNGAAPSVVLRHPRTLGDEAARNLRKSWRERFSGPKKANGVLVLEEDIKVEKLTIPPEQAQFLQTRQFNVTEIARWYNVPPHLLRELSKSSFNNIVSENLHYILISINPWLIRWESESNRQMLMESEKESYFFKFNVEGYLRGDMESQANYLTRLLLNGIISVNEIRDILDMNPVANGDIHYFPLNMTTLENAGKDQQNMAANSASTQAVRHSLSAVLTGMIGYEARQAVRMAANPKTFEEKCIQWYDEKFSHRFAQEVGPVLACCGAVGTEIDQAAFTLSHVERSKTELLSLLDMPVSEFGEAVQETVDNWGARVFEELDSVLG